MRIILIRITLLLAITVMAGCATKGAVKQDPLAKDGHAGEDNTVLYRAKPWDESKAIPLECKSASRLGCRHRGSLYPWSAWVELKGYSSANFEVVEVLHSGARAEVMVVER